MTSSEAGAPPPPESKRPETIESRYEVLDSPIPNQDEILACPEVENRWAEVDLSFDEEGRPSLRFMAASLKDGSDPLDEEQQTKLLTVLAPTIALVDGDFRTRTGSTKTKMTLKLRDYIVPENTTTDAAFPHRDNYEHQYNAAIGKTTKCYKDDYELGKRDITERIEVDAERVRTQVELKGTIPETVESGQIIHFDRNSVHCSPDADPDAVGTRRTVLIFLPRADEQAPGPDLQAAA